MSLKNARVAFFSSSYNQTWLWKNESSLVLH